MKYKILIYTLAPALAVGVFMDWKTTLLIGLVIVGLCLRPLPDNNEASDWSSEPRPLSYYDED